MAQNIPSSASNQPAVSQQTPELSAQQQQGLAHLARLTAAAPAQQHQSQHYNQRSNQQYQQRQQQQNNNRFANHNNSPFQQQNNARQQNQFMQFNNKNKPYGQQQHQQQAFPNQSQMAAQTMYGQQQLQQQQQTGTLLPQQEGQQGQPQLQNQGQQQQTQNFPGYNFFSFAPRPPLPMPPQDSKAIDKRQNYALNQQQQSQEQQRFGGAEPYNKKRNNNNNSNNNNPNNGQKRNNNNSNNQNYGNNRGNSNNQEFHGKNAKNMTKPMKILSEEEKEEIRKWVEQRKKNYPSAANLEKKQQQVREHEEHGGASTAELSQLELKLRKKIMISSGSIKKLEIKLKHLDMLRRVYTEGERAAKKKASKSGGASIAHRNSEYSNSKGDTFKDKNKNSRTGLKAEEATEETKEIIGNCPIKIVNPIEKDGKGRRNDRTGKKNGLGKTSKKISKRSPNKLIDFKSKVKLIFALTKRLAEKRKIVLEERKLYEAVLREEERIQKDIEEEIQRKTAEIEKERQAERNKENHSCCADEAGRESDSDDDEPIEIALVGFNSNKNNTNTVLEESMKQEEESQISKNHLSCEKETPNKIVNTQVVASEKKPAKDWKKMNEDYEREQEKKQKRDQQNREENNRHNSKKNSNSGKNTGNHMKEDQGEGETETSEKIQEMIKELREKRDRYDGQLELALNYKENCSNFRYKPNTLLTNLLLDEIYRERNTLLQAIRYIVINNFLQPEEEKQTANTECQKEEMDIEEKIVDKNEKDDILVGENHENSQQISKDGLEETVQQ